MAILSVKRGNALKLAIIIAILAIASLVSLAAILGQHATLIVNGDTPMWDRPVLQTSERHRVDILRKGTRLPIVRCADLVSDFMFEVTSPSGRKGYVSIGKYHVEVKSIFPHPTSQAIVFNCIDVGS